MDKRELNQLVFWMKERDELTKFRNEVNHCDSTILKKTTHFGVIPPFKSFQKEFTLTDIQMTKLWAFLDAEIKHLNGLINEADQEDREIAEAIYKGDIGKDVIM